MDVLTRPKIRLVSAKQEYDMCWSSEGSGRYCFCVYTMYGVLGVVISRYLAGGRVWPLRRPAPRLTQSLVLTVVLLSCSLLVRRAPRPVRVRAPMVGYRLISAYKEPQWRVGCGLGGVHTPSLPLHIQPTAPLTNQTYFL